MQKAFTLLELLIVLAIIGILSAISYPIYTAHIMKTHRATAKVNLLDLASRLEQYYVINNHYKDATLATLNFNTEEKYYHYEIQSDADHYIIYAIPTNSQAKDSCGTLSYDYFGNRKAKAEDCW